MRAQQLSQGMRVDGVGLDLGCGNRPPSEGLSQLNLLEILDGSQSYITPQFQPASRTAAHGSSSDLKNSPTVRPSLASRAVTRVRPSWSMTCTCEYRLW